MLFEFSKELEHKYSFVEKWSNLRYSFDEIREAR